MKQRIGRRAILRGAVAGGAVAVALPWLEALQPKKAIAGGAAAPKRIIFWFTANGTRQDLWTPPTTASGDLNLAGHPLHEPLAPFSDTLIFLDGVNQEVAYQSIGDGHQTGMACLLTNAPILPGNLFCEGDCAPGSEQYVGWGGGISVDQYIAGQLAADVTTKFQSLELGVQVKSSSIWSRMSYTGADQPVPHREDPSQNFNDFFSDLGADPFALEVLRRKRKSVLDAVGDDYSAFNKRLGKTDRVRLEQHLDAIRQVEMRLDATSIVGEGCEVPGITQPGGNFQDNDMYPVTGKAQMDMLVMALACDMTRVASLQWSTSVSNVNMGAWLPMILNEGHHGLSHYGDEDGSSQADILTINRWYTEQFAYLLGLMAAMPEGDGTLLDNSVVVWVNELSKGNTHARDDIPFLIAGDCQGYFKGGRALDLGGQPHGRLLVSLCHAMGTPCDTFGAPEHSQGELPGLTG